ncbi:MAG: hypothetical protein ACD_62C00558G0001 [uncultured bacterium]|nr:MAG: hypothetical protein ACD_62C00558G0001 [uncultured bacterium]HLD45026.1 hypothetical protein [bacterium]
MKLRIFIPMVLVLMVTFGLSCDRSNEQQGSVADFSAVTNVQGTGLSGWIATFIRKLLSEKPKPVDEDLVRDEV